MVYIKKIFFSYVIKKARKEKGIMNVKNCKRCRKLFNYSFGVEIYCPSCKEAIEEIFHKVKEYIRDNKGASIEEVSKEFDIKPEQIHKWLQEGRLELTEDSMISLSCKSCGARILSGTLCKRCEQSLKEGFGVASRDISSNIERQNASMQARGMQFVNTKK